jgi:hypothetical protein
MRYGPNVSIEGDAEEEERRANNTVTRMTHTRSGGDLLSIHQRYTFQITEGLDDSLSMLGMLRNGDSQQTFDRQLGEVKINPQTLNPKP